MRVLTRAGACFVAFWAVGIARADDASKIEFYEKKIRPLFVENCYNCHSANTNSKGGLRVDDRLGLIHGGNRGAAIVPGHPEKSLALKAVKHMAGGPKMPPGKQLTEAQIADLERWIADGAAWPQDVVPFNVGKRDGRYEELRKSHWAWQPLQTPTVPEAKSGDWARTDVDRFILAGLEKKKLSPVGDADPGTLLRRVTFDLTGLPPTPEAIEAFRSDSSPRAFEAVVDRLLASPAFGERWGRHWLDVARFGESTGSARNLPLPHAWRYRDYVIDAFNADKPYDQFLREQIAGDLLPAKNDSQRQQQLIATGFLALGVKDVNQRFKVRFIMDNIDEQIDTVTRSVLGLTASCARCHDHKFDPIPTHDYYALAGIFHSSDLCASLRNKMGGGGLDYYDPSLLISLQSVDSNDPVYQAKVAKAKAALEEARSDLTSLTDDPKRAPAGPGREKQLNVARKVINQRQNELLALTNPAARGPVAYGVRDAAVVGDTQLRIRGEAEKLGPTVPRGYLTLVDVPDAPKINPNQSGRLELAQWLTSPNNPLTSRVIVNRVWKHLFGTGIVSSVDNFGVTGDVPTHPELLDHLARQFVRDGWSIKKLVRQLTLTRTYQLSADATTDHRTIDPANRLVWRHAPRRLDAEEIRDAMLAVAGDLDPSRPKGSPAMVLPVIEIQNSGPQAKTLFAHVATNKQRSVYLPLVRGITPRPLEVFDFAEQGMVTGSRDATTVAPQALYLLNDPFVAQQARSLARHVDGRVDSTDESRVDMAYRLTLGRSATPADIERAKNYLADFEADDRAEGWVSYCQALLACAEFRYLR